MPSDLKKLRLIHEISLEINQGETLGQVVDSIWEKLSDIIPYNRIGVARFEPESDRIRLICAKSDGPMALSNGFSGKISGSSLTPLIREGKSRIINDLIQYLEKKPTSHSTRLMVQEGMRSNLTLPLLIEGRPFGVLFFSSREPNTYSHEHEDFLSMIASHLAISLEKSNLIEELRNIKHELIRKESLAVVGEMAASIAHEIKNPLAGIRGAVEVISDGLDKDDDRRPVFKEIIAQVTRLDTTIRELLLFSKPQDPQYEEVRLRDLLDRTFSLLKQEPGMRDIELKIEDDSHSSLRADPRMLHQIFINLLQNASHAMHGRGTIAIEIEEADETSEIRIKDNGCGIPQGNMEHLFKPFYSTKARGTGLGLAITKKMIDALQGSIHIDSKVNLGTMITLQLPREVHHG